MGDFEQMDAVYEMAFAGVSQARLVRVEESHHFIMHDQPERFAREVRTFLAE